MKEGDKMTTGEKLALLRKEKTITQEELAEILSVSRQSISKWEQDRAFPETEKLIKLSELYNCSIDYLLKDENKIVENVEVKKTINKKKVIFTFIWSLVNFVIIPLIFLLPVEKRVYIDFPNYPHETDTYITVVNIYNFYEKFVNNHFWILLFFIPLSCEVIVIIFSVVLFCTRKRGFYIVRYTISCLALIFYMFACFLIINNILSSRNNSYLQIGTFVLLGIKLFNVLGLAIFKFNRYSYLKAD